MIHFAKFVGIGGISTLIQFLLLMSFIELELASEVIASASAYMLSSVFNYLANYYFTFASNTSHIKTLPRFIGAVAIGLSANTLLFALFLFLLNNYLIAQFLATGITVCLNYMVHKLWIYRNH